MKKLTDQEFIEELKVRFSENEKALKEIKGLMDELKSVNLRLMESEAMKSHFLSNIRNEMNNPLAAILGLAQSINSEKEESFSSVKAMALNIYKEAFELDFQIKNIFMAAEIEAGECRIEPAKTDVKGITELLVDAFSHRITGRGISVTLNSSPAGKEQLHGFVTDAGKLKMVLTNVLNNCLDHSPHGSEITIDLEADDKTLKITICDQGTALASSPGRNPAIYDRFRQLDTGTAKSHKGCSLNFSVTQSLIELLEGSLELKNIPDKGNVFTITLPQLPYQGEVEDIIEDEVLFFNDMEKF